MYFSVRPSENIDDINIQLLDNVIEYVNVYKYLGIQLDPKLSFNNQYNETYKLASYKLLLLKRVRPVITEFTALTIVKTMLLPYCTKPLSTIQCNKTLCQDQLVPILLIG